MKKCMTFSFVLFLVLGANARTAWSSESVMTQIAEVTPASERNNESVLLVFATTDGRVYQLDRGKKDLVARVTRAWENSEVIQLKLENDMIVGWQPVSNLEARSYQNPLMESAEDGVIGSDRGYEPTNLSSMSQANMLFNRLWPRFSEGGLFGFGKTQCYQKAMVWAYEMWTQSSVKSMKVFLFFTKRYIREAKYKWWFHTTPMVYVNGAEYALDHTYTNGPTPMRDWTDIFMGNWSQECPTIQRYSHYSNHQESNYCYLAKLPMYYYQPLDFQNKESGFELTNFRPGDLKQAQAKKK